MSSIFTGFTASGYTGDRMRFALVIEGWPILWATDEFFGGAAVTDFDDFEADTRPGLMFDGLAFSEELDIREHTVRTSPMTFSIRSPFANTSFPKSATTLAFLATTLTSAATTMVVSSITNFTNGDYIYVGTEALQVTSVPSGNSFTVQRAVFDSQAQHHKNTFGAASNFKFVPILDAPPSMEGRMVKLWAQSDVYSQSDGDPHAGIVWRGIVKQAPTLDADGATWRITAEPITSVMDQELASSSDSFTSVRGVYHPWNHGLYARWSELDRHPKLNLQPAIAAHTESLTVGFWEREDEFADEVAVDLNANLSPPLSFGEVSGLSWAFQSVQGICTASLTTGLNNAPPNPMRITLLSELDGTNADGEGAWGKQTIEGGSEHDPTVEWLARNTTYTLLMKPLKDSQGGVTADIFASFIDRSASAMRSIVGPQVYGGHPYPWVYSDSGNSPTLGEALVDNTLEGSWPDNRIYIVSNIGFDATDGVVELENVWSVGTGKQAFINSDVEDPPVAELGEITLPITALVTTSPYIEINKARIMNGRCLILTEKTKIIPSLNIGQAVNVGDALQNIVDAAEFANQGSVPFITTEHFDVSGFKAAVDEVLQYDWQKFRYFRFKTPVLMNEWMIEELKLLNMHLYIDSSGLISARKFVKPSFATVPVETIDKSGIVLPYDGNGEWPRWVANRDGIVNTMVVNDGYRPRDDSYIHPQITVRDVSSISHHKNRGVGVQKISPKSGSYAPLTEEDIETFAGDYFGWFAEDYFVTTLAVTYKHQDLLIGDVVHVTSDHVIDPVTGLRGVVNRPGIVVGREWNFNPVESEQGRITVMFHRHLSEGYAPSFNISSAVDNGSDNWTLTGVSGEFTQTGVSRTDSQYFLNNFFVRAVEYNQAAPGSQTGQVVGTPGNGAPIIVQFDGAAPWGASYGGTDDYHLESQVASSSAVVATGQGNYIYIADSGTLSYDSTSKSRFT